MAVQRYISTSFWDDSWIRKRSPEERYIYLYLLTNPLTNIAGVYETTIERISFDTGIEVDRIIAAIDSFASSGKAFFYGGYIILPSWPKHQKAESRHKIRQGIDGIVKNLPRDLIKYMVSVGYRYDINTLLIGSELSDSVDSEKKYLHNYSDSDSDSDTDTDAKQTAPIKKIQDQNSPILLTSWYREFQKRTARMISPSEEDRRSAVAAMAQLSGDEVLAAQCVAEYWTHWEGYYFATKKGTKEPDWNFRSFARNITSCIPKSPANDPPKSEPKACPNCGEIDRYFNGSCRSCGYNTFETVEEYRERIATEKPMTEEEVSARFAEYKRGLYTDPPEDDGFGSGDGFDEPFQASQ